MKPDLISPNGTPVSPFCFGTMQFGGRADAKASAALYDSCRAAGITFFDTAYVYTDGASETLLGEFAAKERDDLIIATKVDFASGNSAKSINHSFDVSRTRLGMDFIDILYLHKWDQNTPLSESFEALAALQQAGKIGHIAVSNFAAWQVVKAQQVAQSFGCKIAMIQPMYNLVKRQAEVEILPMAASENIHVAPYSPLGGGLLTGKYVKGDPDGRLSTVGYYTKRYGQDWMHKTAAGLSDIAARENIHPATLAVAWAAAHPAVSAPIISARSVEQLQPSLGALNLPLSADLYAEITALSRTPPPATDRIEEQTS